MSDHPRRGIHDERFESHSTQTPALTSEAVLDFRIEAGEAGRDLGTRLHPEVTVEANHQLA